MPTINLTDQFGLNVDVTTDIPASISKYFSNFPHISLADFDLNSIAPLTLDHPSVTSLRAGLAFDQPVNIGAGGVTLKLNAGVNGAMNIVVPPAHGTNLFNPDPYGENIAVAPAERYVSIAFSATAGPDIASPVNQLTFGFNLGATVTLTNYQRFETGAAAPTVIGALQTTLANFSIPGGLDDLRAMLVNSVVTLEGTGTVKVSGSANLLTLANPLATVSLPSPIPALDVSAGGSVTVGASYAITWDYQLRVRKLDANRVTLGFHRKQGSETTVSVGVHGGVSASVGGTDLVSAILGLVSKSAAVQAGDLTKLGVPPEQIAGIQSAVNAAAQRKLEVAMLACLTDTNSQDAAFLYEFDLSALDAAGTEALGRALGGDLQGLEEGSLPPGVEIVRSIFTNLRKTGFTWKINLLGIYNQISVTEMARTGSMLFEPATGDLVLTDSATAKRVAASTINFGADTDKLRRVLAESFLITAVYRGSRTIVAAPELECSHSYFARNAATDGHTMRAEFDVAAALGLMAAADEQTLLGTAADFGTTMIYAETSYDAALANALFLNGAEPRPVEEYQAVGREALQLLVHQGDADDFRLSPLIDNDLWAKMVDQGQFNFGPLFPGLSADQVGAIATDYTVIVWWAETMNSCAQKLAAMQALLAANPDPQSAQFTALRKDLANHLADVASKTKDEFGQPWGLVAMDRVSLGRGAARVQITGNRVALAQSRARTQVAAG